MTRPFALLFCFLLGCGAASPRASIPDEPAERDEDEPPPTYAIALRLEDAGTREDDTPRTRVMLVAIAPGGDRTVNEVRVELGACWHDGSNDALITARCWWAGAGAVYAIRREGGAVVAHRRSADEASGERPWEEAGRVEIPEDAALQILLPGRSVPVPE